MTKKRIIAILLCLVLAFSLALAACKDVPVTPPTPSDDDPPSPPPAHKHSYSQVWSSDEQYHWHEATCEHTNLKGSFGQHTIVKDVCTTCGKTFFKEQEGFEVHPYEEPKVPEIVMPAVPTVSTPHLALHYRRNDEQTYKTWGYWVWADGADGVLHNIQYQDDFGSVTLIDLAPLGGPNATVGIIPRLQASWVKDGDVDRFIVPSEYTFTDNCYHVYLVEGDIVMHHREDEINFNTSAKFDAVDHIEMTFATPVNHVEVYEEETLLQKGDIDEAVLVGYKLEGEADLTKEYKVKATFATGEEKEMTVSITALYDTEQFTEQFYYEGDDLGATISGNSTTFKVWSPVSTQITLNLYNEGTGGSATTYPMEKGEKGVWAFTVQENLAGKYYTYTVVNPSYPNGAEIVDPYAKSAGQSGVRGMVVNFDSDSAKPAGWDSVQPKAYSPNELTVWETHVADVTSSPTWNGTASKAKTFLGMIEPNTTYEKNDTTVKTGFDHIVELGVNAVQLVPIFDQANDESNMSFNWGYNPLNYNVLEGGYSSDPTDGYARIKEFRQLVQAFNEKGINIIMDVVYNHVSSASGSNFDVLMPGYYFRYDQSGMLSNGSGCGNETASERAMMRKFIIDSVCFWAKTYKLGGFRFDLMGLHDIETMNQVVAALKKINPNIIVYGEPWTGGTTTLSSELQAIQANANSFEGYAQFNDQMRDALIKGGLSGASELGWATGGTYNANIENGLKGYTGPTIQDMFKTVNYVTCHDNYTLADRVVATGKAEDKAKKAMLANSVVFTSNGITFMLAGEEFLRSKGDLATSDKNDQSAEAVHNSYQSSYQMNSLNYELKITNADMFANYKKLIAFKQKFVKDFGLTTNEKVDELYTVETIDKNSVVVVTIKATDGTIWKVAHCGPKGGSTVDFGGYTVYLDTIGNTTLSASTTMEAYQTIIAHK